MKKRTFFQTQWYTWKHNFFDKCLCQGLPVMDILDKIRPDDEYTKGLRLTETIRGGINEQF